MHVPFIPIGPNGAYFDVGEIIRFQNSGSDRSVYLTGTVLRDVIDLTLITGQPADLDSVPTGVLRNLTTPATTTATVALRSGSTKILEISVSGFAAVEGDVLELEVPFVSGGIQHTHRRLFTTVQKLQLTAEQISQLLDLLESEHYIVSEFGGYVHYFIKRGTGDHTTGTVLLKQELFDLLGNPIQSTSSFIARSIATDP